MQNNPEQPTEQCDLATSTEPLCPGDENQAPVTDEPDYRRAVIIGAGPAGLTAAYELLGRTGIVPIVLEKSEYMGGISRTLRYKGNRMDIGGHRFFSKSDRVMQWWLERLPLQRTTGSEAAVTYHRSTRSVPCSEDGPDPDTTDPVMLIRSRKSRIYYLRRFFDYPLTLNLDTIRNLGLLRSARIVGSYLKTIALPVKKANNLEEFFISRFGKELYLTFFKTYTEKVWGVACSDISAEWGQQRIKGLSISKAIVSTLKRAFSRGRSVELAQKDTETSLIEQFLYPKFGPGQMWEEVARQILALGGQIHTGWEVRTIEAVGEQIKAVTAINSATGEERTFSGTLFFSTMPVRELVSGLRAEVPAAVREVSDGLVYRDFVTVGLLLDRLIIRDNRNGGPIRDNWIYIQEPDVRAGRLQVFGNWSPYLVADPSKVWVGVEYFCQEGDDLWSMTDGDLASFAALELAKIGIIDTDDLLDSCVYRMPKSYPAYFGTYDRFHEVRSFLDSFSNLFLIGRNGMHKYNNQDHSMLTAMIAVDNIVAGREDRANIWDVNTEMDYHENSHKPEREELSQVLPLRGKQALISEKV